MASGPPKPLKSNSAISTLAEFRDAELIAQTCELALSSEVRTQNAPFLLRACIANESNGSAAWRFVADHWQEE